MAATRAAGKDGGCTSPSGVHEAVIARWNLAYAMAVANVTGFADVVGRNRVGIINITASASGVPLYGSAGSAPISATGTLADADVVDAGSSWVFTQATGCSLTATMGTAGINQSSDIQSNEAAVSFDLVYGDATAPTIAWAES